MSVCILSLKKLNHAIVVYWLRIANKPAKDKQTCFVILTDGFVISGDSKGGLGRPCPPRFLLGPMLGPLSFFLIFHLSSFD